jgi:hypothetical protein
MHECLHERELSGIRLPDAGAQQECRLRKRLREHSRHFSQVTVR